MKALAKEDKSAFLEASAKELAARLLKSVIKRTPVGETRALRRGWKVKDIKVRPGRVTITVFNPMHYASYVEYGHRTRDHEGWVEGQHMLEISSQEIADKTPALLQKKLKKYLEAALNG